MFSILHGSASLPAACCIYLFIRTWHQLSNEVVAITQVVLWMRVKLYLSSQPPQLLSAFTAPPSLLASIKTFDAT